MKKLSVIKSTALAMALTLSAMGNAQYKTEALRYTVYPVGISNSGVVGYGPVGTNSGYHARLLNRGATGIDLHPLNLVGAGYSLPGGVWDNTIVGYASGTLTANRARPVVWKNGVAQLLNVIANPMGAYAFDTDGISAVGYAYPEDTNDGLPIFGIARAYLWNLATGQVTDLSRNNKPYMATGVFGNQQVGSTVSNQGSEAVVWNGTANSMVNLHPNAYETSTAVGTNGDIQIGDVRFSINIEGPNGLRAYYYTAGYWSGTAESFTPLDAANYQTSHAIAIRGDLIVGTGSVTNFRGNILSTHALAWTGVFKERVDLEQFLEMKVAQSGVYAIGPKGEILGWVMDAGNKRQMMIWRPI